MSNPSASTSFLFSSSYAAGISFVVNVNVVTTSAYFLLSLIVRVYFPGFTEAAALLSVAALKVSTLPSTDTSSPSTLYSGLNSSGSCTLIVVLPSKMSASATSATVLSAFTGT